MDAPKPNPMKIEELIIIVIKFLQIPLAVTYDQANHETPFPLQYKSARVLSTCQEVSRQWRFCASRVPPSIVFRDSSVCLGNEVVKNRLVAHGNHIKRLFVQPPDCQGEEKKINHRSIATILGACPALVYIHWNTLQSPDLPSLLPTLQNLTRLDFSFHRDSVPRFKRLVSRAPALEYITVMGIIGGGDMPPFVTLPHSVTTISLSYSGATFDQWIQNRWHAPSLACLISSVPGLGFKKLAKRATKIDLRPSFAVGLGQYSENNFEPQIHALPKLGRKGTLVYSTFFCPPLHLVDEEKPQFQWVQALSLKTSGSSDETKEERWAAASLHLGSVLDWFPNLTSIDLYDDFGDWKEREEVQVFAALAEESEIVLRYV